MPRAASKFRNLDPIESLDPLGHPMAQIVSVTQQPTAVRSVPPREQFACRWDKCFKKKIVNLTGRQGTVCPLFFAGSQMKITDAELAACGTEQRRTPDQTARNGDSKLLEDCVCQAFHPGVLKPSYRWRILRLTSSYDRRYAT